MYFVGLTKCFGCGQEENLLAGTPSGWRAIKAEKKIYFFCEDCQPLLKSSATADDWKEFYATAIQQIYEKDFQRPIRKILILRDEGTHAQIINNLN